VSILCHLSGRLYMVDFPTCLGCPPWWNGCEAKWADPFLRGPPIDRFILVKMQLQVQHFAIEPQPFPADFKLRLDRFDQLPEFC
jgi:hypothetical protein